MRKGEGKKMDWMSVTKNSEVLVHEKETSQHPPSQFQPPRGHERRILDGIVKELKQCLSKRFIDCGSNVMEISLV